MRSALLLVACAALSSAVPTIISGSSFSASGASKLPTVFMHGMGDSCFNEGDRSFHDYRNRDVLYPLLSCLLSGMQSITEDVGKHLGTKAFCIPTGPDQASDTNNGDVPPSVATAVSVTYELEIIFSLRRLLHDDERECGSLCPGHPQQL